MRNLKTVLRRTVYLFASITTTAALAAPTSTTTSLAISVAGKAVTSSSVKTPLTLTATVQAGTTPVPRGTVNFCDASATYCSDVHILGTAQLTSAGTATTHLMPAVGSHSYKAVFAGTNTQTSSISSAATLTVTGMVPTYTTIAQRGTSSGYTFTGNVAQAGNSTTPPPTGTVSFVDTTNSDTLLGTGTLGTITDSFNYYTVSNAAFNNHQPVLFADFNEDGIPDFITLEYSNTAPFSTLSIWLGNGDGTFRQPAANYLIGTGTFATGDFNGDGKLDLLLVSASSLSPSTLFLGNGDGTFKVGPTFPLVQAGVAQVLVADFNGDGNLDFLERNAFAATGLAPSAIYLGNGDGTFTASGAIALDAAISTIQLADFNGDGKLDLALTDVDTSSLQILLGNGDGSFASPKSFPTRDQLAAVADFNNDGVPDLCFLHPDTGGILFLFGKGDGTFSGPTLYQQSTLSFQTPTLGDFNGDGKADVVDLVANNSGALTLFTLLGNGDGTFTPSSASPALLPDSAYQGALAPSSLFIADYNGDGFSDVFNFDFDNGAARTLLAVNQYATATATDAVVPPSAGVDSVIASYAGDLTHRSSVSASIQVAGRTLSITPASLVFPLTFAGGSSPYQLVTLSNTSSSTIDISSITIGNTSTPYSWGIREQTCGTSLAAGASCTFNIVFRPTSMNCTSSFYCPPITETANIRIHDNVYGSPQLVSLKGELEQTPVPPISIFPAPGTFGPDFVGSVAPYQYVTVSNNGVLPITIQSIAITNSNDPYAWGIRQNTCPAILPLYEQCSFAIAFRPTHAGTSTADVTITSNAPGSPLKITLTGTGK